MKRPNPASKKPQNNNKNDDASAHSCRCYLDLCSPTSAFKAPAGGDALSSAPWLLHTPPVFLSSAGITLQTYFPYAPCFCSFLLCAFTGLCVWRGWRVMCDQNLARLSRGGPFYWHCSPRLLIHGYLGGVSSHLLNACLVMVLASASENGWKGRCCVFVSSIH